MVSHVHGRLGTCLAAVALVALAAARAGAQSGPEYQVEASLDRTGSHWMYSTWALLADREIQVDQFEATGYSISGSRFTRLAPRISLRYGVAVSNAGYSERTRIHYGDGRPGEESWAYLDVIHVGTPLAVGYNLISTRRGVKPFVEAGIRPELLVRQAESEFVPLDLARFGLSYTVNLGLRYKFQDGRGIVIGPEARIAAKDYGTGDSNQRDWLPVLFGIKAAVQF